MRIIGPNADADPDDARIINTWVRNQRSEHTRGVYRRDAGKLLSFAGKPLRAITLDDLQAFACPPRQRPCADFRWPDAGSRAQPDAVCKPCRIPAEERGR